MTSTAIRIYTVIIAIVCGAALAWSIHQSSVAAAWRADSRSWQVLAQRSVAHDRMTTHGMRQLVGRYNRLVARTRRSERLLLTQVRTARRASATRISLPQPTIYQTAPGTAGPAPVAPPAPVPPTTSASPVR
jgi:hypothetical protein